jgi:hypothetical protein
MDLLTLGGGVSAELSRLILTVICATAVVIIVALCMNE